MESFGNFLRLAAIVACVGMAGCAGSLPNQANAKPGENIVNRESAPLCQLYPGNYPQSAECMISPR